MRKCIYCGECSFLRNEDIDGYGICVITKRECNCGDKCFFSERNMNDAEALKILHYAQNGEEDSNVRCLVLHYLEWPLIELLI